MDAWRRANLAAVRNRDNNPETALKDAYVRQMWSNHLRFRNWNETQLGQLDLPASEAFYRHRFSDAARFTWFFVGDFDPASLEPLLCATVGALPSESGEGGPGDDGAVRMAGVREETVYAGLEPKARLRWRFHGPFADPVENRVRLYALRDVLEVLLREEIREKRGGAYAISVGAQASTLLGEYTLTIDFSCDPDRLTELEDATTAVLRGVQEQGLTGAVVEAEREMNRRGYQVELRTNSFWRALLANAVATLEDPADLVHGFERRNDALTPESLQDAARTWLDFDHYVKVRLLPLDRTGTAE
jgi:zinc protease